MTSKDTALNERIDLYMSKTYGRYVTWYEQNANLARTNLLVGFGVVVIAALCLVFFPGPMEDTSFLQIRFNPTNAVKLGLAAAILLALYSMFTSLRQKLRCSGMQARLQAEFDEFDSHRRDTGGDDEEADFNDFRERIDALMAASNPGLVTAIERDNAGKTDTA